MNLPIAPERSRTVRWTDPGPTAQAGLAMSGLDYLCAIRDGRLPQPPISALIGFTFETVEPGRVVMALEPGEHHYNPLGIVHGGVAATVLDSVVGCAVHSTLPAGTGFTTLEIKINYLRAMTADTGTVRAEGRLIHGGRRTAVAEGRIVDEAGRLYATASTTCLILPPTPQKDTAPPA
jgi:uncharacterized protein (TIGR00369 family)